MADDETLWQVRLGKHPALAEALDAMRADRGITRPEMVRSILLWAVDQRQRDCDHAVNRYVDGRCGACGAPVRPVPEF